MTAPLLCIRGLARCHGARIGCADESFELWSGEVPWTVGESGSGRSRLPTCLAGHLLPEAGSRGQWRCAGASRAITSTAWPLDCPPAVRNAPRTGAASA